MSVKKIELKIITPREIKVSMKADMVIMRCSDGDLGVLPGHDTRSVDLSYGVFRIKNDGEELKLAVYGGIAVIQNDTVTAVVNDADWPYEIDYDLATLNRAKAEQRMREKSDDLELQNDQIQLWRALVQIELGSPSLTESDD